MDSLSSTQGSDMKFGQVVSRSSKSRRWLSGQEGTLYEIPVVFVTLVILVSVFLKAGWKGVLVALAILVGGALCVGLVALIYFKVVQTSRILSWLVQFLGGCAYRTLVGGAILGILDGFLFVIRNDEKFIQAVLWPEGIILAAWCLWASGRQASANVGKVKT
jgi:hypothetical protein